MTYQLLHAFAGTIQAVAGVAIGLSFLIVTMYWRVYRSVSNGARLLPAHIIGIGISYSMLAFIAVARLGDPPPPSPGSDAWWVYPFATAAFVIGDVALVLILRFVARRGPRHSPRLPGAGRG